MLKNLWNFKIRIFQLMFISWTRVIQFEQVPRAWYERHSKFLNSSSLWWKRLVQLFFNKQKKLIYLSYKHMLMISFLVLLKNIFVNTLLKWWKRNLKWAWWRNLGSFSDFKLSKQVIVYLLANPSMPMIYLRFLMESVKPCGTPRSSSTRINKDDYKYLLMKMDIEVRLVVFYIWQQEDSI